MGTTSYDIYVHRDHWWWMIRVPALDGYLGADGSRFPEQAMTQAHDFDDIEREAIDFISTTTGATPETVAVQLTEQPGPNGRT